MEPIGENSVRFGRMAVVSQRMSRLSTPLAERLLEAATAGVVRPEPNVLSESLEPGQHAEHAVAAHPAAVHPAFYGCFDWHSAVHSHWLLLRLLRTGGPLHDDLCARAVGVLDAHLTADNLAVERASIEKNDDGWEMPYGLCWFLLLTRELSSWAAAAALEAGPATTNGCSQAQLASWSHAADALADSTVRPRVAAWLDALEQPDRSGAHRNTAFSLCLLLDASRGEPLEAQVVEAALRLFSEDSDSRDPPPLDSRGRAAFLSPSVRMTCPHRCPRYAR